MKRLLLFVLLLLLASFGLAPTAVAQKEPVSAPLAASPPAQTATITFGTEKVVLTEITQDAALAFAAKQYPAAQYGSFRLLHERESPAGRHYLLQQYLNHLPVYGGTLKLNFARNGRLLSSFSNLFRLDSLKLTGAAPASAGAGKNYIVQQFGSAAGFMFSEEPVWYVQEHQLKPGTLLIYSHSNFSIGEKEVLLNAAGQPVQVRDLLNYFQAATDTIIKARVFLPDPLTSAQQLYRSPYIDSLDADIPQLNQELQLVDLPVWFQNDTFYLKNDYCEIQEFDAPARIVCHDTASTLSYTRSSDCFEQVNILYHISSFQQHVQALGFLNLQNQPIAVDANGLNGLDQSRFSPLTNTLAYGEGGVDDGEDADVIIHEYAHALAHAAAPGTNTGLERHTIEEGNSDYFAASYSAAASVFNWQKIFNWDGHNEYWAGRQVVSSRSYPKDLLFHQYYDAEIWSSTLMQVNQDLGRTLADKLLLQSLYSYAPNLSMPQAAGLFLQADTLLHNGVNASKIFKRFEQRGILKSGQIVGKPEQARPAGLQVMNSSGFSHGESLEIQIPADKNGTLLLTDVAGRKIETREFNGNEVLKLSGTGLAPGVYLLHFLLMDEPMQSVRLLRH